MKNCCPSPKSKISFLRNGLIEGVPQDVTNDKQNVNKDLAEFAKKSRKESITNSEEINFFCTFRGGTSEKNHPVH